MNQRGWHQSGIVPYAVQPLPKTIHTGSPILQATVGVPVRGRKRIPPLWTWTPPPPPPLPHQRRPLNRTRHLPLILSQSLEHGFA